MNETKILYLFINVLRKTIQIEIQVLWTSRLKGEIIVRGFQSIDDNQVWVGILLYLKHSDLLL